MCPHAMNPARMAFPSNIIIRRLEPRFANNTRLMECIAQLPTGYKYTVKSPDFGNTLLIFVNVYDSEENEKLVRDMTDDFHRRLGEDPRTGSSVEIETADSFRRFGKYTPLIEEHYALLGLTTPPDREYRIERPDEDTDSGFESIHYGRNSGESSGYEYSDSESSDSESLDC